MGNTILKMNNITKSFYGVKALKGVSLELEKGEVHALLGENGAGKSTLMKCLAGIYSVDGGTMEFEGKEIHLSNPMDSMQYGISVIHQELALAEQLTVADNMYMGQELSNRLGFIDNRKMNKSCEEILKSLDVDFNIYTRVFSLSTAQKQMLEIAKAVSRNVKILVMDEPTAAVSSKEVDRIFQLVRDLKGRGVTIVYISHRMDEIFEIADRITVLRDGANAGTAETGSIGREDLVRMMVGYSLDQYYAKSKRNIGDTILTVQNLTRKDGRVRGAGFSLRKGEIVGLAGLVGSGRTELIETLFGLAPYTEGQIVLYGQEVKFQTPEQALKHGICLVPEDRKTEGLILQNHVRFNLSIGVLDQFIGWKWLGVNQQLEMEIADTYIDKLSIKIASQIQQVIHLSGGNQQKIVVGKWLAASKDILILDEPTRGIDVGAKAEIYALMEELTEQGKSIIMVSSELPEVINMSDRIYIMRDGEIRKTFEDSSQFDQEEILSYMIGLK
ncbi:Galactose/methyl galactoside import ATP-binding protein MglA [Schaedlerella arabinosiphila]|nr:Galactose/methyl galactoside import ATP-binding protein MglA [Schaedlerella arabinosiphila]